MQTPQEKAKRIEVVNAIIAEIASRGRKFFKHKGAVAYIFLRGNKVFMKNEYNGAEMCLSIPDYKKPTRWHHGGTLMGLARDFKGYIQTGKPMNGENGYGGLYCPHWGYPAEDMKAIQDKAIELGYLQPIPSPTSKNNG